MAKLTHSTQYVGDADGIMFVLDKMHKFVTLTHWTDEPVSPQKLSGIARQLFGESVTMTSRETSVDACDRERTHVRYYRTAYTSR